VSGPPPAAAPGRSDGDAYPYWRLSSFYGFYFALLGAWLPFWPLYLQELGYGAAAIGALVGIMQVTKVVAPSIWGWLADRSGARLRVIRAGGLAALLVFLCIFAIEPAAARGGFIPLALIIVGYSFFWNAVLAQFEVVTLAHLGRRFRRYSLVRVWGSVGFIAAVAGLGFAFDRIALHWLPVVVAMLLAGMWLSTLSVGEAVRDGRAQAPAAGPLRDVLRRPEVVAFFAACFLLQFSHGPYYTFLSLYLELHGYSRGETGLLWSLGVVAEVVLFLMMHWLLARFSLRQILLASLALTALRWLLIGAWVDVLPLLLIAQCLHAASFASYHAAAVELVRRLFAGGHEGQGMALYSGISYGAGAATGALASGLLWSVNPVAAFALATLAALLAVAVGWRWIRLAPEPA
jgi:PPP family 3-phenylpropionic acid transporter